MKTSTHQPKLSLHCSHQISEQSYERMYRVRKRLKQWRTYKALYPRAYTIPAFEE